MKLLQKLLSIRKSVEYIQKTEKGNQGAMYVDPAVLLKKIRDKMDESGVLLVPSLVNAELEQIPMPTKNNDKAIGFLFKSGMSYTWYDCDSDETLPVPWVCTGKHGQDPAMAQGGALTYSERYFLLKFFQIPTAKDDPEYFKDKTKVAEPPRKITIGEANVAWLVGFCKKKEIIAPEEKKTMQEHYGFDPYKTTVEEFAKIKESIMEDYNEA